MKYEFLFYWHDRVLQIQLCTYSIYLIQYNIFFRCLTRSDLSRDALDEDVMRHVLIMIDAEESIEVDDDTGMVMIGTDAKKRLEQRLLRRQEMSAFRQSCNEDPSVAVRGGGFWMLLG